jgi:hypothetical protein
VATIDLTPSQLGARLRSDEKGAPKAVQRAMFSAVQRGKAYIVGKTPVDRGILRNAWQVIKLSDGVELTNDQPYAGVIETGSRPFKMSRAGILALKGWVMRKIKSGEIAPERRKQVAATKTSMKKRISNQTMEKQAESIAYAIAKTFEKIGMKGRRFVMNNLPQLAELMDAEISRYLDKFFNRGAED